MILGKRKKKALILGVTGQDGSYLSEFLLDKDYEVFGMTRRSSSSNLWRVEHLLSKINLVDGDLSDYTSIYRNINTIKPNEVYNLAAQSFVKLSFEQPLLTADVTGLGCLRVLEAIREVDPKGIRFYQASSSEMFGKVVESPQNESTPFNSRSPYGSAKLFAHYTTVNYRQAYNIHASSGILYNHESPRRGEEFVTRKITTSAARIALGLQNELRLGNLDAQRDWGYAADYVRAMFLMLQQDEPGDYVVSTGETHSVREFCQIAFDRLGLDYEDYVVVDPKFFRPTEVDVLLGDSTRARKELGWKPETSFKKLVSLMVDEDYKRQQEKLSS